MNKSKKLTLFIPEDKAKQIKIAAIQSGKTLSKFVLDFIKLPAVTK